MLWLHATAGLLAVSLLATPPAIGASPTETFQPPVASRAWDTIVLHHSATTGGSVASIDAVHRQQKDAAGNPWLGIGYHFVIGNGQSMGDGEIQPTFRWQKQLAGAHAGERRENEHGIGICLIGNFDQAAPTDKQVEAIRGLVKLLAARYSISRERVVRHQDVHATLCPGKFFPWQQVLAELPPTKGS